jgi:hypothetical protein
LNGGGGNVQIGISPNDKLVGQEVADISIRDIAAMVGRLETTAHARMTGMKCCMRTRLRCSDNSTWHLFGHS